jgi:hypothetical protein
MDELFDKCLKGPHFQLPKNAIYNIHPVLYLDVYSPDTASTPPYKTPSSGTETRKKKKEEKIPYRNAKSNLCLLT